MGSVCDYYTILSGIQDSEWLIFCFFLFFLTSVLSADSSRRSHSWWLIAEAMRGQSLSGIDAAVLLVAIALEYTFRVWSIFGKLDAQLEVRRVVRVLLEVG